MLAVRPAAKLLWTLVFCMCPAGMYLSNFIRGGSKFWLLKSTTVLMHRYIEIWKPTKSSLKVIMPLVCSNL